jgi:hypothetical protein
MSEGDPNQRYALQLRDFKSEEEQKNTILIRYLTLEKFLSLLELEAVWFSRLGALQDQFEGTLPKKTHELSLARNRQIATQIPIPQLHPMILGMTDEQIEVCRESTVVNCWFLGDKENKKNVAKIWPAWTRHRYSFHSKEASHSFFNYWRSCWPHHINWSRPVCGF